MKANSRYLITFMIANVVCYVMGQYYQQDEGDAESQAGMRRIPIDMMMPDQDQDRMNFDRQPIYDYYQQQNPLPDYYQYDTEPGTDVSSDGDRNRPRRNPAQKPFVHQSLCLITRRTINLEEKYPEYEFYPIKTYVEVKCLYPFSTQGTHSNQREINKECGRHSYDCVTRNITMSFTRRLKINNGKNCWEHFQEDYGFGCECMWPAHLKGHDMKKVNIMHRH